VSINLQDAYIAVEHAYSMQQFPEALRLAQDLVPRIPSGSEDQLDLRLQLLIGHTYLYGLGLPQKALPCYQQVLKLSYDPTYRELAEQGVALCQQAGVSLLAGGSQSASPSPAASADEAPSSSSSGMAVPWLEDLNTLDITGQAGQDGTQDKPGLAEGLAVGTAAAQPWQLKAGESVKAELVEKIEAIEAELVEGMAGPSPSLEPTGGLESPQAFSPAEAAELAKGLLKVVLR